MFQLLMRRTRGLAGPMFKPCRTGGLVHGVGNAYGLGGALTGWSPLDLFAGGKLGAWYDPSDLSTLFQDSAGTIPVTSDGQPVGKILDKSGNGNHAIQPTAGKRPTYRVASNAHWLDFDGVDDALYTATIDLSGTSKLTVFGGTANSKTLSTGTLIESSANYMNNGGSFALLTPSLTTSHVSFGTHGSAGAGEKETQNPPSGQLEKRVITAAQDFGTTNDYGCDYIRVQQIPIANLVGSGNTAVGAGPLGNYPVYIGARNNGSNAASGNSLWGRIYSLIFVGEMYNTETLVLTEEWIDAKMVGTLFEPVWSWYAYQVALGATATFTRASTAYVVDHLNVYKPAMSGEGRYNGARRIENLLPTTANFEATSGYTLSNCTVSGKIATCNSATLTPTITYTLSSNGDSYRNGQYPSARVRIKYLGPNASSMARLQIWSSYGSPITPGISVTCQKDVWLDIATISTLGFQPETILHRMVLYLSYNIPVIGDQWQIDDAVLTVESTPSVVPEYVSKGVLTAPYHGANVDGVKYFNYANGNTRDAGAIVTEAHGAPISPTSINLLMEPAATNLCLQSQSAGTTWTQVNITIALDAVTAPNGSLTADTLTASAVNATWQQATTAASAQKTWSLWIKRKTGTGTISMSLDGGTTYTDKTITAEWVRYSITQTVANPSMVLRIATSGDAVWVWGSQLETGSVPTSYIPTTTVAVTRAVDALAYSGVPADNETRFVVNGANIDVDDWNGTYPTPTAPNLLNSINVYNVGEREGGPWTPVRLFAGGKQGAWYDPSDLNTLFQDAAGTIPVTADGQPVGKILDKSGNGNHATQATAGKRPLYKTGGGLHWLLFDGTDDALATNAINFTGTDKLSVFAGVKKNSDAARAMLIETGAAISTGGFNIEAPDSANPRYFFRLNNTALASTPVGFAAGQPDVITVMYDMAGLTFDREIICRIDGFAQTLLDSGSTNSTGNFASNVVNIGMRAGNQLPFNGVIYSLIIRGALSTSFDVYNAEHWSATKSGVIL